MKAFFFDFTINYGGAPQGSIYLMERLSCHMSIEALDAYGCCYEYVEKLKKTDVPYRVLHPTATRKTIGFTGNKIKRIYSIFLQLKDFIIIIRRLREIFKDECPDIVWANNEKSLLFLIISRFFLGPKVVLYYRGEGLPSQISRRFVFLIKHFVAHVIVHSRTAGANLVRRGLSAESIAYVPNCINFSEPTELSVDLPTKHFFRLILPAARPVLEKGHLTALKAIALLKEQGIDVEILFPGRLAYGNDDRFITELNDYIVSNNLDGRVHFIGWRDDLAKDIVQCDLVILPSHTEGFPRSIIEAMMLGVPVCATPVGGIPEAVLHDETGLLFAIDDFVALANCISTLYMNSERCSALVYTARQFANQHFLPSANTDGVRRVFNDLAAK